MAPYCPNGLGKAPLYCTNTFVMCPAVAPACCGPGVGACNMDLTCGGQVRWCCTNADCTGDGAKNCTPVAMAIPDGLAHGQCL
jgi:hypothetical protein